MPVHVPSSLCLFLATPSVIRLHPRRDPHRKCLLHRRYAHHRSTIALSSSRPASTSRTSATVSLAQVHSQATTWPKSTWNPDIHELQLYNTLVRDKQRFTTHEPGYVRFYSCGPTVYDYAHIGNFRAFLTYDVIKRWLMYRGYKVNHVMNLTDVDDKIIRRAQQQGCDAKVITEKFTEIFFSDLSMLNVIPADKYPACD